jgi:hypothetical protein
MTTAAATRTLLHDLVAGSHAEGVTALAVEAAISHDDQILLITSPRGNFTDDTCQLPAGPVPPGQTLTDALHPALAAIGLSIQDIIALDVGPCPAPAVNSESSASRPAWLPGCRQSPRRPHRTRRP